MTSEQRIILNPELLPIKKSVSNVSAIRIFEFESKTSTVSDFETKTTTLSSLVTTGLTKTVRTESVETTVELKQLSERKLELQFPEATRVCSHQERVRYLWKYCRGPGKSLAAIYKSEVNKTFQSTTVGNLLYLLLLFGRSQEFCSCRG